MESRKEFDAKMEKVIHEFLRFSNINNDQLSNKKIVDKINLISNIVNKLPLNIQEAALYLIASYITDDDKNISNIDTNNMDELLKKIGHENFIKIIMESNNGKEFRSNFGIPKKDLLTNSVNFEKLTDKEGLNVPMYLINKFSDIDQISFFLITYYLLDPKFIFYEVKKEGKLVGHSFLSYMTIHFLDFVKNPLNINNDDIYFEFSKYVVCLFFSIINLNNNSDKNKIINKNVKKDCTILDIYDKIILKLYIKMHENYMIDDYIMGCLALIRCILVEFGFIKSDLLAQYWTSTINISSSIVPFPNKEYWTKSADGIPLALKSFYENEEKLDLTKLNDPKFINYFNIIYVSSFNLLPVSSQKLVKMVKILNTNLTNKQFIKNVPYFLNQMNIDFINDKKVILTEEILQQHKLGNHSFLKTRLKIFRYSNNKNSPRMYYTYSNKSTIKDLSYDYVKRICLINDIKSKFTNTINNINEFDYYIDNFDDISINLPDLKITGFTIPMYMALNKINNLSSFLAAYEQLDPSFTLQKYKRSGGYYGFSVLSFILYNFLSDINDISNDLLTNYIESIDVILTNLENQPEKERCEVFDISVINNFKMLDQIIIKLNENKTKYEKEFIDKKLDELCDLQIRFKKETPKC